MVKSYKRKYLSFVLLVCMLIQICIPSSAVARATSYNDDGLDAVYEVKDDTNSTVVEDDELKCIHGKTKHEPCVECGILTHSDKNIALAGYEQEFFDSILPPDDVDEEDLDLYKLHSIRLTCLHGSADGTYCDECQGIVNISVDDDYISCAILDSCIHGKVKGEKCDECRLLKESQGDYELAAGEEWNDPLIYAAETESSTYTVAILNTGYPSYNYVCSLCDFYLGNDVAWINNVHHCADSGCNEWAKPSLQIQIRGTCTNHEGRVILQGGHHLGWIQHYGGSHKWQTVSTETQREEATCTETGYIKKIANKKCSNCSTTTTSVESTTRIDALGHDYQATGTEERVTESTCQAEGKKESVETQVCSRCGDTREAATTLETYPQLDHKGSYTYTSKTQHTLECEGVNTEAHSVVENHNFVADANGEDFFCNKRDNGCDAVKTYVHVNAYQTIDGDDKLIKKDIIDPVIVHYQLSNTAYKLTTNAQKAKCPTTLSVDGSEFKILTLQAYSTFAHTGGIELKAYYEDITPKSNYTVEHYKQMALENGLSVYKLVDTDMGECAVGQAVNADIKEYEGYELAEDQATSLVISENSAENVLKIYYNKAKNDDPFSVWVPSAIYIDINEEGKVTVKDNPAIYNAIKSGSIAIKKINLHGVNGWAFSENALELKDKQTTPVGIKKLNVTLNGDPIKVNGENNAEASVAITPDNWVIAADSFLPLNIGAVASAQAQDVVSTHVFTMDFVAGWDKADASASNYLITLAESEDGGLSDDSIGSIFAIGGNVPSIPDAVPYDAENMQFVGWFIQGSDTNIKDVTTISENITIEPRFDLTEDGKNKILVKFAVSAGGSLSGIKSVRVNPCTEWETITKPTVTANEGYIFDGWYNADGEKIVSTTQILENQTVTAAFHKIGMKDYFTYDGNVVTGLSDLYLNMLNAPTDLILPTEVNGQTLTTVGIEAFRDQTALTSITVPDSYTWLRTGAFNGCTNADIFIEGSNVWYGPKTYIDYEVGNGKTYDCSDFHELYYPAMFGVPGDSYCKVFELNGDTTGLTCWKVFYGVKSVNAHSIDVLNQNVNLSELIYLDVPIYVNDRLIDYRKEDLLFLYCGHLRRDYGFWMIFLDANGSQLKPTDADNWYSVSSPSDTEGHTTIQETPADIARYCCPEAVKVCGWDA